VPETTEKGSRQRRLELLRPVPRTHFESLNPLTRLAVCAAVAAVAIVGPGLPVAALTLGVVAVLAAIAQEATTLRRSVAVVLIFGLLALAERLLLGTRSGGAGASSPEAAAAFGAEVGARIGALVGAISLLLRTTDLRVLGIDLERRGLSRRLTFDVLSLLALGPSVHQRMGQITAAQRARGLRTDGPLGRTRARLPLLFPTLVSTLTAFAEGSLALESRAGGRPGPRTLLWWPVDPTPERVLRFACGVVVVAVVALRVVWHWG
jgi:energy-coupling factor transporter transmembrane protein EcfT